jgi:hypothetical protein
VGIAVTPANVAPHSVPAPSMSSAGGARPSVMQQLAAPAGASAAPPQKRGIPITVVILAFLLGVGLAAIGFIVAFKK